MSLIDESKHMVVENCTSADVALYGNHGNMHRTCSESTSTVTRRMIHNGESPWDFKAMKIIPSEERDFLVGTLNGNWPLQRQYELPYAAVALWELERNTEQKYLQNFQQNFAIHISSHCVHWRLNLVYEFASYCQLHELPMVHVAGGCAKQLSSHPHIMKVSIPHEGWMKVSSVYATYQFCLVFENTIETSYVTEKIITAFYGGCIPMYAGPSQVKQWFDSSKYIHVNISSPNFAEIQGHRHRNVSGMSVYDFMTPTGRDIFDRRLVLNNLWSMFTHNDFIVDMYNWSPLPPIRHNCLFCIAPYDKRWLYLKNPKSGSTSAWKLLEDQGHLLTDSEMAQVLSYSRMHEFQVDMLAI